VTVPVSLDFVALILSAVSPFIDLLTREVRYESRQQHADAAGRGGGKMAGQISGVAKAALRVGGGLGTPVS
jgi:hypothetical protein